MSQFWDQRFAEPGYKYGTEPNAFLLAQAGRLRPAGRVLVPGDGEGRNGVWLAEQGHTVLSMDSSGVGLSKVQALAAQRGVSVDIEQGDLAYWAPVPGAWDAVVLTYVHLPTAIRQAAHRRLVQGLSADGWFLLEAFHPLQLQHHSGGPRDPDMLYTVAQLREDLSPWCEEVIGWEGPVELREGPGHQGTAYVTRWLGRRHVGPGR